MSRVLGCAVPCRLFQGAAKLAGMFDAVVLK
jgi:hypothetical protein